MVKNRLLYLLFGIGFPLPFPRKALKDLSRCASLWLSHDQQSEFIKPAARLLDYATGNDCFENNSHCKLPSIRRRLSRWVLRRRVHHNDAASLMPPFVFTVRTFFTIIRNRWRMWSSSSFKFTEQAVLSVSLWRTGTELHHKVHGSKRRTFLQKVNWTG